MKVSVDVKELDKLDRDYLRLINSDIPNETKKFMRREAGHLRTETKKEVRGAVSKVTGKQLWYKGGDPKKHHTGNYYKSIKPTKGWQNQKGGFGSKVIASRSGENKGYHAHLLEYGHRIVSHGVDTGKRTTDFLIFTKASELFDRRFHAETQEFIGQMIEKRVGL